MSHHSHFSPEFDNAVRLFIRRHKRGLRLGLLAALLLVFVLAIVAAWALFLGGLSVKDWLASKTPLQIPLQGEQSLGEAALTQMRTKIRFITDQKIVDPLNRLAAPLFGNRVNSADRFSLFIADLNEINALALPGGFIVFNRGLLERARAPEEIQGVLAHEMAHVTKRHGVLQLAQGLSLQLALQLIQENNNSLKDALIGESAKLLSLKFSRDHERAADDLGWELLQQAQINPQGMVDFFSAMKTEMDAKGPAGFALGVNLLSTHPTPQERIDRLQKKQAAVVGRNFKSFAPEFRNLQAGLGIALDRPYILLP